MKLGTDIPGMIKGRGDGLNVFHNELAIVEPNV